MGTFGCRGEGNTCDVFREKFKSLRCSKANGASALSNISEISKVEITSRKYLQTFKVTLQRGKSSKQTFVEPRPIGTKVTVTGLFDNVNKHESIKQRMFMAILNRFPFENVLSCKRINVFSLSVPWKSFRSASRTCLLNFAIRSETTFCYRHEQ